MQTLRNILGSCWARRACWIVGLAFTILCLTITIPFNPAAPARWKYPVRAQILQWCESTGGLDSFCIWYNLRAQRAFSIRFADQFPGSTSDVQITNCIGDLPGAGGTCDARGYNSTVQILAGTITFSSSKPVSLVCDPSTQFNITATSTQPFSVADGTDIQNCQIFIPANWNSSVFTLNGSSGTSPAKVLHLKNIRCIGTDVTAGGSCINITVSSNFISWAHIEDIGIRNLASGIFLKTTGTGFITANWLNHVTCWLTTICFNLQAQGTNAAGQISGNNFTFYSHEFGSQTGIQLISATSNGTALLQSNDWVSGNIFDPVANQTVITFSGSTAKQNSVRGSFGLIGIPLLVADGAQNTIIDLFNPGNAFTAGPTIQSQIASGAIQPIRGANATNGTCDFSIINSGNGAWNSIVGPGDTGMVWATPTCTVNPTGGFVLAPWAVGPSGLRLDANGNGKFGAGFKIADQGTCTMAAGTCSAQSLSHTYAAAPNCLATWNGSGTLTGILKSPSTTTTVTPASSVGTDTAVVNWFCPGS